MNTLQALSSILLKILASVAVGLAAWWIYSQEASSPTKEKAKSAASGLKIKEDDLNKVIITAEAEKRLGIQTGKIVEKSLKRNRTYGGEITIPVGNAILVAAPLGGTINAPREGVPKVGQIITSGQHILELVPILTPDAQANLSAALTDAEGQVNNAKTSLDLSKIALDRAKRVLNQGAGSQRQVDEAQAAYDIAEKLLDAVKARQDILKKVVGDSESGSTAPIIIDAPENGILRMVSVMPGQTVPSGAALFEVVDLSIVWVRVPIPVSDWENLDRVHGAVVGPLTRITPDQLVPAKPIAAPPTANPLAATVDMYYRLPNPENRFTPGQRVGVQMALNDPIQSLTAPWSAIMYDIYGGTWIYEQVAPLEYVRRRITIRYTVDRDAVLEEAPPAGTVIVTAGIQELFGSETGFVK